MKRYIQPEQTNGRLLFLHPYSIWVTPWSAHNPDDPEERRDEYERQSAGDIRSNDHDRCWKFRFILSRIPAMLAKAAKSDAVAALRSKAFPPHARQFPKLTRRARQAMEKYAAVHGYAPYIDGNSKHDNQVAVSTPATLQELLTIHPPLITTVSCRKT